MHGEQNWTKASLTLARHHGTQVLLDLACQSDGKTRDDCAWDAWRCGSDEIVRAISWRKFSKMCKNLFPQWHDLSWRNILWSAHAWHWVSRISWIIRNVTGGTTWRKPWVTLPSWQTSCGATKMARLGTSYCTALARSVQGSLMHCSKRLGRSLTAEIAVRHSLLGWVAWQASSLSAYGLPVTLELWSGCVFQYNFSPTCS